MKAYRYPADGSGKYDTIDIPADILPRLGEPYVTSRPQGKARRALAAQIAERLASIAVRGDVSPQSQLDQRGLEIFKLMAEGLTNAEIAEQLNLSTKTISNISQSVKEKLGVHRQAYITKLAVKHGLIEP